MIFKKGQYVKIISCTSGKEDLLNEVGVIQSYEDGFYRILFLNKVGRICGDTIRNGPIYVEFINLWTDDELRLATKDEVMVNQL